MQIQVRTLSLSDQTSESNLGLALQALRGEVPRGTRVSSVAAVKVKTSKCLFNCQALVPNPLVPNSRQTQSQPSPTQFQSQ